ncbi:MAG: hypothetical protein K2F83_02795 [Oscillospiraceae bacterium]|nr:hypothetical protein [Oscillospiraceae bacterium]
MKKRILSLTLALSLAVSLCAPAFAAEEENDENYYTVNVEDLLDEAVDPDLLEQIIGTQMEEETASQTGYLSWYEFILRYLEEERPEIRENFDADAFFAEEYPWWEKEEYMELYEYEEEDFEAAMWEEWVSYRLEDEDEALAREIDAAYQTYLLETYEVRHPGELEGLSTEDLLKWQGYYDLTAEAWYMQNKDLSTVEEVRPALLQDYVTGRLEVERTHAGFLAYQARYPEKWAEFDADAYFEDSYFAQYFDSKETYMSRYALRTEEEFAEAMFVQYVNENLWKWLYEGGNQGSQTGTSLPSLVINGEYYRGEDFVLEDGVSYLDGATLSELLGTDYEEGPVSIRAAAQAAGWDVVWNEWNSQVILLDREKLTHGVIVPGYGEYVEYDFSTMSAFLNGLLAAGNVETGKTLKTAQTGKISLTLMDSLDGDKTYDFGMTMGQLSGDGLFNCDLTLDLADLMELFGEDVLDQMMAGLTKPMRQLMTEYLGSLKGRLIWNREEETLYVNLPVLALLDESLDPETWYSWEIPVESGDAEELETLLEADWNLGELIYQNLLDSCATTTSRWRDGADYYRDFVEIMGVAHTLFGAHAFTREGDALTWSVTDEMLDSIGSVLAGSYDEEFSLRSLFREFTYTMTLEEDGSLSSRVVLRPDMKAIAQYEAGAWDSPVETAMKAWQLGLGDFRYEGTAQSKDGNGALHMEIHWKNQMKLTVDSETVTEETDTQPLSAPPRGSTVESL